MEQLDAANNSRQKIFEQAVALRQEMGNGRYFPVAVQYISEQIGGGYSLSSHEKAIVQGGIIAAQAEIYIAIFEVPIQQEVTAASPQEESLLSREVVIRAGFTSRLRGMFRRSRLLHEV